MVFSVSAVQPNLAKILTQPLPLPPRPQAALSADQFQLRFGAIVMGEGAKLDIYEVGTDERLEQAHATTTAAKMRDDLEALWTQKGWRSEVGPVATIKVKHVMGSGQHPLEVIVAPEDLPAAIAKIVELGEYVTGSLDDTIAQMGPNRNNLRVYDWSYKAQAPKNILSGYQVRDDEGNRLPFPQRMTAEQLDEALATNQVPPYTTKLILKDTNYDMNLATVVTDLTGRIDVAKKAYEASYPKKAPVAMNVVLADDLKTGQPYIWVQTMKPSLGAANAILSTALPGYADRLVDSTLVAFRKPWPAKTQIGKIRMPRLLMRIPAVRNAVDTWQDQEHNLSFTSPKLPEFVLPVKVSRMDVGAVAYAV